MKQLLSHSLNTCPNNMYMFDKALEFVFLSAEGQDAMTSCSASGPWWHWSGICSPWRRGTTLALITWLVGRRLTSTRSFLAITTGQPSLHTCFSILVSIPRHPSRFLKELTFLGPSFLHRTWSNFGKSSACWKPRLSWTAESEKMMKNATFECLWQN